MPLPSSGTITLQQIFNQFGAPLNTPFTQMVKGGLYVPSNVLNGANIPTAPPIKLTDFYGAAPAAGVTAAWLSAANCTMSGATGNGTLNLSVNLTHADQSGDTFSLVDNMEVKLRVTVAAAPAPKLVLRPQAFNQTNSGNMSHFLNDTQGSGRPSEAGAAGTLFYSDNNGRTYYCDNPDYYYGVPGGTPGMDDIDAEQTISSACTSTVLWNGPATAGDVLSSNVQPGNTFDLTFNLGRRVLRAFIGGKTPANYTVNWSAGGFGATFGYDLRFINGSTVVQSVPLQATIRLYGNLAAKAVIYP